jgi:transcriptional regulator with XRE-family HTH domain
MPSLKETIAENLSRILNERKKSQSDLAKDIGVSVKSINQYCNGKAGITGEMISKMSGALGVEETDLVAAPNTPKWVEVDENAWKLLDNVFKQNAPKSPAIPQDILDGLSNIDPRLQETAWVTIRALLAGLRGEKPPGRSGKSSSEAG